MAAGLLRIRMYAQCLEMQIAVMLILVLVLVLAGPVLDKSYSLI